MATPFSTVDPLQVQAKGIQDFRVNPLAPAQALEAGATVGKRVQEFDGSQQFQKLLQAGQEGMTAVAEKLVSDGTLSPEEIEDPNLPVFQSANGQLAWYQGVSQKIQAKAATKARASEVGMSPLDRAKAERTRGVIEPKEFEERVSGIKETEQKEETVTDIQGFVDGIPESELLDIEPAVFAARAAVKNPRMADEESIKTITKMIEERRDRIASKERAEIMAKAKKEEREDKKKTAQQDLRDGLDVVIALAENVTPSGRIIGLMKNIAAAAGLDKNTKSLNDFSGIMSGQVAKRIGGESGRLTDQDRIFALRVLPKAGDTKAERAIKINILKLLRDKELHGAELRNAIYSGVAKIRKVDHKEVVPAIKLEMLPKDPNEKEIDVYLISNGLKPTPELRQRVKTERGK